jgi:hypothetical protein
MTPQDDDKDLPAFLRLPPGERPQRMRCLTPMVSLGALDAARERYEARFGAPPDERYLQRHGIWHRVELLELACERGIALEALPEAQPMDDTFDDPTH